MASPLARGRRIPAGIPARGRHASGGSLESTYGTDSVAVTVGGVATLLVGKLAAVRIGGGEQRAGLLLIADDQIEAYRRTYRDWRGKYARQRRTRGEADGSVDA